MKHILRCVVFVTVLVCGAAAFGQTPPPAPPPANDPYSYSYLPPRPVCGWWEFWCGDSVYRNPNLSPVTKKVLYGHDPRVCHCDQCRRLRLAAGVEYQGLDLGVTPPLPAPQLFPPPKRPNVYTLPESPAQQRWRSQMLVFCRSTNSVIARGECPEK